MPRENAFRPNDSRPDRPAAPYHRLTLSEVNSAEESATRMQTATQQIREAGVAAIYLLGGTFVGNDPTGLARELGRFWPKGAETLQRGTKHIIDRFAKDTGNYTEEYARAMEHSLLAEGKRPISVERFLWSSENCHLGRADAAVRLLDQLGKRKWNDDDRILFWGFSHGGNVLALVSNLLTSNRDKINEFFAAARIFYRNDPTWHRVYERLIAGERPVNPEALDFVTLGMPIAYGFDCDGYGRLLHLINHRPRPNLPEYRTALPRSIADLLYGTEGDFVHHIGIPGSNFYPSPVFWRQFIANHRLRNLVVKVPRKAGVLARVREGVRVPTDGTTLLVDYGSTRRELFAHLLGHGVYTHERWRLFHTEQIAKFLYSAQ